MLRFTPYITTDKEKESLKTYRYKGTDHSIVYNYIVSPLCNETVKYLPSWLAPNLITLTGFLLNVIINFTTLYYSGLSGDREYPSWVCYFCAILYLIYIFLDCLDGKQARATKSSSPMGLLFDHGCDSCTTFLYLMSLGSIIRLTNSYDYIIVWFMASIPFFSATLEEYYLDELTLPMFNGVMEGAVISAVALIFTGVVGSSFWLNKITIFSIVFQYNQIIVYGMCIVSSFFSLISYKKILMKCKGDIIEPLKNGLVFSLMTVSIFSVSLISNSNIAKNYPKVLLYLYGFAFAKLVAHLMLAHLTGTKFDQKRKTIIGSSIILLVLSIIDFKYIDVVIICCLVLQITAWAHLAYNLTGEMCEILKIKRFSIKKNE